MGKILVDAALYEAGQAALAVREAQRAYRKADRALMRTFRTTRGKGPEWDAAHAEWKRTSDATVPAYARLKEAEKVLASLPPPPEGLASQSMTDDGSVTDAVSRVGDPTAPDGRSG